MDYNKVDPNMVVNETIETADMEFYDVLQAPFSIHGVYFCKEENRFIRLPDKAALAASEGVQYLSKLCAGGRIRFRCNSDEYAIITKQPHTYHGSNMSDMARGGFDLYIDNIYNRSFTPPNLMEHTGYSSRLKVERHHNEISDITIHMPTFGQVESVYIGIKKGSRIESATPYKHEKPVVFYGSSITQGACSSRPGNIYENILSRRLDFDYINLGFAGQCKAEPQMADYINSLDMSIFVFDYDHNAKTLTDLIATHEPFYNMIREKHPCLPIIFASRPLYLLNETEIKRRDHIKGVYLRARANGDENVYFVDGSTTAESFGGHDATVDGVHPTDMGFFGMAEKFQEIFEEIYNKSI